MLPYKIAADKWVNDPKQWPAVDYKDVYTYLFKGPQLSPQEVMENYRALAEHTFFVSGWVQTMHHLKTTSGHVVLRADVKLSWRVTEEPHYPWVTFKPSGPVVNAHCEVRRDRITRRFSTVQYGGCSKVGVYQFSLYRCTLYLECGFRDGRDRIDRCV